MATVPIIEYDEVGWVMVSQSEETVGSMTDSNKRKGKGRKTIPNIYIYIY